MTTLKEGVKTPQEQVPLPQEYDTPSKGAEKSAWEHDF